jgi:hypothetical protein
LIIFNGVSAPNDEAHGDSKKAVKEIRIIQRVMARSFSQLVYDPITPSGRKCPAQFDDLLTR